MIHGRRNREVSTAFMPALAKLTFSISKFYGPPFESSNPIGVEGWWGRLFVFIFFSFALWALIPKESILLELVKSQGGRIAMKHTGVGGYFVRVWAAQRKNEW